MHRLFVGVNTDLAEVEAEAGLEEGARRRVERLPGRTKRLMNDARCLAKNGGRAGPLGLELLAVIPGVTCGAGTRELRLASRADVHGRNVYRGLP